MTCALFYHSETASEPRKALWEGVETAVLENTKLKKVAFNTFKSYECDCMARIHGDELNHPHDDFVRRNKSRMDDYIILNYLLTHLNSIN
jgi:hypothetical protein